MINSEFKLIDRIKKITETKDKNIVTGIGDDTAVLKKGSNKYLLFTCDCLVENIHFPLNYTPPKDLGWKALAVNVSDISAMGGLPTYAIVSLILNEKIDEEWIDELYKGFKEFIKEYPLSVVGGNISRSNSSIVIDIAMLGEVEKNKFVKRSGAKVGDLIVVTGTLGDSKAGMETLKKRHRNLSLCKRHLHPTPRLKEIKNIVSRVNLNSMIDISDGLTQDLSHILEASNVSATIDKAKIPLSPQLKEFAGNKAINFALEGGEDYEMLFTLSKKEAKKLPPKIGETKLTVIGEIKKGNSKIFLDGKEIKPKGFNHFKK